MQRVLLVVELYWVGQRQIPDAGPGRGLQREVNSVYAGLPVAQLDPSTLQFGCERELLVAIVDPGTQAQSQTV